MLKTLLGEELSKQVIEALKGKGKDGKDVELIQKTKLDEQLEENKTLKKQVEERDTQLKELADKAKGNDELTKKIRELQEANEAAVKELEQQKYNFALEAAVNNVKGKSVNTRALKAMLSIENIKLEGDKLIGFDEQIAELKKTDAYLFDTAAAGGGGNPPSGSGRKNPWSKDNFNLTEQGKILKDNPALAKSFAIEAGCNPEIYGL